MKNYDKRVRQTRILLSDYLLLKGFAQKAGVSMSEALHDILTRRPLPELAKQAPVTIEPSAQPAFGVSVPIPLRVSPQPTVATNGHKAVTIGVKVKGVRYA